MQKTEFEAARALLLEKGIDVSIQRKGISRWLHRGKERHFVIRQSYGGTLLHLSKVMNSIQFEESMLTDDNFISEGKKLYKYAPMLARIIAIGYLNSKWKIRLFSGVLSRWFLWHLTPEKMLQLCKVIILDMNNMLDFITTIRLTGVQTIVSRPENLSPEENGG